MRKLAIIIMLTFLCGVLPARAADIQINAQFNASTGDSNFDTFLRHMNVAAGGKLNVFVNDLVTVYNVPQKEVHFLLYEERVQPADAFMILQLVRVTGEPINKVVKHYHTHRGKGWGAVAYSFGIKPGTQKYIILTQNIPSTIWNYEVVEVRGSKGSKAKRGSKGSSGKKHHKKQKKGSKGKKHH